MIDLTSYQALSHRNVSIIRHGIRQARHIARGIFFSSFLFKVLIFTNQIGVVDLLEGNRLIYTVNSALNYTYFSFAWMAVAITWLWVTFLIFSLYPLWDGQKRVFLVVQWPFHNCAHENGVVR